MKKNISIVSSAFVVPGDAIDVSFVPPLLRRRFSPLQKTFFALANAVNAAERDDIVFASHYGEDELAHKIVADYVPEAMMSAARFSSSVFNAAPGLWSIFTHNTLAYTAIAGGEDSVESGLLEAVLRVRAGGFVTFVYADEVDSSHGFAMRLSAGDSPSGVVVAASSSEGGVMTFDGMIAFLKGETQSINGKWISLAKII